MSVSIPLRYGTTSKIVGYSQGCKIPVSIPLRYGTTISLLVAVFALIVSIPLRYGTTL